MQPRIGQWNCFALGQAMLPVIGSVDETEAALAGFEATYEQRYAELMRAKLGLTTIQAGDDALLEALFAILQANHVDFTLFFRRLSQLQLDNVSADAALRDLIIERPAFDAWAGQYRQRLRAEGSQDDARALAMNAVNPKYVLRNYLAQNAIERAADKDFSEVARLLEILRRPFDEQPQHQRYAELPPDWAAGLEVSCSS
jgi:uncharacterized protein YdiU (UPF0061 family)